MPKPKHKPTLDIPALLSQGWEWVDVAGILVLSPPEGDERCTWAARWIEIEPGKRVPHWAYHDSHD